MLTFSLHVLFFRHEPGIMFLTSAVNFGLTCLLQAKKAKADRIVVLCKSVAGTGHGRAKVGYLGETL
jgi:hypothetical protein